MSDSLTRRHGLESFLQDRRVVESNDSGLQIEIMANLTHVNIRADSNNAELKKTVEDLLGQSLPGVPNSISIGEHRIYWLGPNEWLFVGASVDAMALCQQLQESTKHRHIAVNDISGGQLAFRLTGGDFRDVLAKGCTIDFHPKFFKPGDCAQSGLAKANILIGYIDQPTTFELIVRRSYSEYTLRWLEQAGGNYGIEFR